jgi:hypothetical protein
VGLASAARRTLRQGGALLKKSRKPRRDTLDRGLDVSYAESADREVRTEKDGVRQVFCFSSTKRRRETRHLCRRRALGFSRRSPVGLASGTCRARGESARQTWIRSKSITALTEDGLATLAKRRVSRLGFLLFFNKAPSRDSSSLSETSSRVLSEIAALTCRMRRAQIGKSVQKKTGFGKSSSCR